MAGLTEDEKRALDVVQRDYEFALETQRHFDDLILRFRTTGFTVVGVFLSGGIGAFHLHPLLALCVFAVTWILLETFRSFDRNYYHQLLLGAVARTTKIDKTLGATTVSVLGQDVPIFGLTESITESVRRSAEKRDKEGHSSTVLIQRFYSHTRWALIVLMSLAALIFVVPLLNRDLLPAGKEVSVPTKQVVVINDNSNHVDNYETRATKDSLGY